METLEQMIEFRKNNKGHLIYYGSDYARLVRLAAEGVERREIAIVYDERCSAIAMRLLGEMAEERLGVKTTVSRTFKIEEE